MHASCKDGHRSVSVERVLALDAHASLVLDGASLTASTSSLAWARLNVSAVHNSTHTYAGCGGVGLLKDHALLQHWQVGPMLGLPAMGLPLSSFSLMGQGRMRQVNPSEPIHQHCSVLVPTVPVAYHSCPYCAVAMLCRLQVPHSPHSHTQTHTGIHPICIQLSAT